jgi:hypothetical protein
MRLDLDDLERAVRNPALSRLLMDGWNPLVSFAGEYPAGSGKAAMFLILRPPPAPVAVLAVQQPSYLALAPAALIAALAAWVLSVALIGMWLAH